MTNDEIINDLALIEDVATSTKGLHESWFKGFVKMADDTLKGAISVTKEEAFEEWTRDLEYDYRIKREKIKVTNAANATVKVQAHPTKGFINLDGTTVRYGVRTYGGYTIEYEHMPDTYRSAKSVVLKAIRNGVDLVDVEGNVVGKTELADASRSAAEKRKDPASYIRSKVRGLVKEAKEAGISIGDLALMVDDEWTKL